MKTRPIARADSLCLRSGATHLQVVVSAGQLGHVPLAARLLGDPGAAVETEAPAHLVVRVLGQVAGALAPGDGGGRPGQMELARGAPGPAAAGHPEIARRRGGVGAGAGERERGEARRGLAGGALRPFEGTAGVEVLHGAAEGFVHCGEGESL